MTSAALLDSLDTPNAVHSLSTEELIELLLAEGAFQQRLFAQARAARQRAGGDGVVLRGVIEVSNFCQKNCDYCAMRASNPDLDRYRLPAADLMDIAAEVANTQVISTLFFQGGQDPHYDAVLAEVIPAIKRQFGFSILLCLGERPRSTYRAFAQLGADSYILKFETSDPALYRDIAYTSLERRLQCLHWLRAEGYKIGTGNIVGLPQQNLDLLVEDIRLAIALQPDFVSASPFIPNPDTPLEFRPYGNLNLTLNTMAIYRLALPHALIPSVSALEKIQTGGQLMGLNAGANILTINFTPRYYKEKYVIYSNERFVVSYTHAMQTLEQAGLTARMPASTLVGV